MNRVSSIFSQILQFFPCSAFEQLVRKHQAQRHSKGFSCWGQFVAMLFCQLGQARSLCEIHECLRASEGKLRHLGLSDAPARSTLAYANQHRPHQLFEDLFHFTFQHCHCELERAGVLGKRIALAHKLYSLDATSSISARACLTGRNSEPPRVPLHLLLDQDGHLPAYAVITPGKLHEIRMARRLRLPAGSMLVFDRLYTDYDWFAALNRQEVFFVTRLKDKCRRGGSRAAGGERFRTAEGRAGRRNRRVHATRHRRQPRVIRTRRQWPAERSGRWRGGFPGRDQTSSTPGASADSPRSTE